MPGGTTARAFASSEETLDTPLRQPPLGDGQGPTTGLSDLYPGGTCTHWSGPAFRTQHGDNATSLGLTSFLSMNRLPRDTLKVTDNRQGFPVSAPKTETGLSLVLNGHRRSRLLSLTCCLSALFIFAASHLPSAQGAGHFTETLGSYAVTRAVPACQVWTSHLRPNVHHRLSDSQRGGRRAIQAHPAPDRNDFPLPAQIIDWVRLPAIGSSALAESDYDST